MPRLRRRKAASRPRGKGVESLTRIDLVVVLFGDRLCTDGERNPSAEMLSEVNPNIAIPLGFRSLPPQFSDLALLCRSKGAIPRAVPELWFG